MATKILLAVIVILTISEISGNSAPSGTGGDDNSLTAGDEIYNVNSKSNVVGVDFSDEMLSEEQKKMYDEDNSNNDAGNSRKRRSIRNEKTWPNGVIPYTFEATFKPSDRNKIREGMKIIESLSCVRFVPRRREETYVHIYQGGLCSSNVGYRGRGEQYLSLEAPKCLSNGVMVHELLHTLGFYHEQSRYDRDDYIRIVWSRVRSKKEHNFKKRNAKDVHADGLGSPYDYDSIMHYGSTFWSNNGLPTIVSKRDRHRKKFGGSEMSKEDINQLNKLYKCNEQPKRATTTPATTESTTATTRKVYVPRVVVQIQREDPTCRDKLGICPTVGRQNMCHHFNYGRSCPKTCGRCGIKATTTVLTKRPVTRQPIISTKLPSTTKRIISGSTSNEECMDRGPQCIHVRSYLNKQQNVCGHSYYRTYCPRSCGKCAPHCEDEPLNLCKLVAGNQRFCRTQPWAKTVCKKSCKVC